MDPHEQFRVPAPEIEARIARLQQALCSGGLGLAWIDHLADRLYFSGSAQDGTLLVPDRGPAVFHVRKSVRRATFEASVEVRPYVGRGALAAAVSRSIEADGKIAMATDVTSAATLIWLQQQVSRAEIVDIAAAIRTQRATKSAWEIEQIRTASDQVTTLYREIAPRIRAEMSELELTGIVEGRLRSLGHGGTVRVRRRSSDITLGVVVCGDSASYPTGFDGPVGARGPTPPTASGAGWNRLTPGQTVMLDIVTSHNGYHADTTRSFYLGRTPPLAVVRAHDRCRQILRGIEQRMKPGACCAEIYRETAEEVRRQGEPEGFMGHGENRVRFFGHGVGLELDELPVLAAKFTTLLAPGMVVAVEPKAFLAGTGPVGVENTYVITEDGCRPLCPVDDALICVDA